MRESSSAPLCEFMEAEIFLKESRKYPMHLSQRNDDLWSS